MAHSWNDSWPHWDELYEAERWIIAYVYKWSRCRLVSKEKWGILCYSYVFPPGNGNWKLAIKLPWDKYYTTSDGMKHSYTNYLFAWPNCWLYYKWMGFGDWILRRAVRKACIKFPNVVKEITCDLNWK